MDAGALQRRGVEEGSQGLAPKCLRDRSRPMQKVTWREREVAADA
jgi:hypothetical protein